MTSFQPFCKGANGITAPAFDVRGRMFVVSSESGAIHQVIEKDTGTSLTLMGHTGGTPSGIAFDSRGLMHIADLGHPGILYYSEGQLTDYVNEYEGKPLQGPNSLVFDHMGNIYFTDSGPLGTTTLQSPKGSLFTVRTNGELLHPILYECLAHPTGVALSPDHSIVYVGEMMTNRVLRCVQRPEGTFHTSVFYTFNGRMGPSALTVDQSGNIYVALFEFKESRSTGLIAVLSPSGQLLRTFDVPASEITGLTFSNQNPDMLYVTEASTNTIFFAEL